MESTRSPARRHVRAAIALATLVVMTLPGSGQARPTIRSDFFALYPNAVGTQLDLLPSNSRHCGVCHFDFNGGGPRNPYGYGVETGRNSGLTNQQAMIAIQNNDSDGDGKTNLVEITDTAHFSNTPTFPGLSSTNVSSTSNIPLGEVTPYLTPTSSVDTTPPAVAVLSPNGGNSLAPNATTTVSYSATDASGIAQVNIYLSDDGGTTFKPVAKNLTPGTSYTWFVPNLPGPANRIRVEAVDNAGNPGHDDSDAPFTIQPFSGGLAPTTLRDMHLAGTQPFQGGVLDDPTTTCSTCHGNYDAAHEPWYNWRGSMMGQAMRDPLFLACMAVAEQDAPSVGDLCIRCHSPGGWQEGRSVDTSGGLLTAKDRQGIQCDYCHRMVDRNYVAGSSPSQDPAVLANIVPLPLQYGNGQFITDAAPLRRGPFADAAASHAFVASPLHRSSNLCGTCHDVSNPVYQKDASGDYVLGAFNAEHPDGNLRNMFPVERTFSEWSQSQYATTGVYAPQFAGNKPDGIVSSCEDCHMADASAKGCNEPGTPPRADLPVHDLMGGNAFIPDILPAFAPPGEIDTGALQAAKTRAISMLQKAATLTLTPQGFGVRVRVINETAHKLPSGYPEGRRIWLHVRAFDAAGQQIFESGAYDAASGDLTHDSQAKIYHIEPGLSPGLAQALGFPAGPSFHFVLNDSVYADNRIPPRGFTNANFAAVQSPAVGHAYADGQYWDDTDYILPVLADSVFVSLNYQTLSKEYVTFLRDANTTNAMGQNLYNAWATNGKSAPVIMAQAGVAVHVVTSDAGGTPAIEASLNGTWPNPFRDGLRITYAVAQKNPVQLAVFDVRGRRVRTLLAATQDPGRYETEWDARDGQGQRVPAGVYFVQYQTGTRTFTKRVMRLQ